MVERVLPPQQWWRKNALTSLERFYRYLPPILRKPSLGLLIGILAFGAALHYGDKLPLLSTAAALTPIGVSTRQSLERILFLLPVMYATVAFGAGGGFATLAVAGIILWPRAIFLSNAVHYAIFETGGIFVVGSLFILWMNAQRKHVEMVDFFVRQIMAAQENERKRISLELHDETAQSILFISQRLDSLTSNPPGQLSPKAVGELKKLREVTVQTLRGLRRISQDLRPAILDHLGLTPALEWLADDLSHHYGMKARVEVKGSLPEVTPEAQLLLFRIAQEALSNVGKHSGATEAAIHLEAFENQVKMVVVDNGRGFTLSGKVSNFVPAGKLGLLGMYERASLMGGTLDIHSEPGKGTTITVEIPAEMVEAPPNI